jgi:hypothetical protein
LGSDSGENQGRIRLEQEASQWQKSRELRRYIEEVKRKPEARALTDDEREDISDWLDWARTHADRLDPISDGLPSEW